MHVCARGGGGGGERGVLPYVGWRGRAEIWGYTFATQSPGCLGPLLNVTDMFRIFGWVFEIYNHKIQIKNLHKLQIREYYG